MAYRMTTQDRQLRYNFENLMDEDSINALTEHHRNLSTIASRCFKIMVTDRDTTMYGGMYEWLEQVLDRELD